MIAPRVVFGPEPDGPLTYTGYFSFPELAAVLASALTKACRGGLVVHRPTEFSAFEFVVLSGLRAAQLMRGCTPRVESGHKRIVTAQIEVATGKVVQAERAVTAPLD
jgi:hypothetical protein